MGKVLPGDVHHVFCSTIHSGSINSSSILIMTEHIFF